VQPKQTAIPSKFVVKRVELKKEAAKQKVTALVKPLARSLEIASTTKNVKIVVANAVAKINVKPTRIV